MALHPLKTTDHLRNAYIKYLKTIKPFQDDELRREFAQALDAPDKLIKGPLLEVSPPFKTGATIQQLAAQGVLARSFARLCSDDFLPFTRPLYVHQERAIRKAVDGRNLVVATGTGSGKTESFLIPVLNQLLHEKAAGTLSQPGVRALFLYPMNALANDQMKRLRRVLKDYPSITFGRYVGETEDTEQKAINAFKQNYPEEPEVPNELQSREEMQAHPPHILLTNYAMLEYLLLRPADSAFFDGETGRFWRFVALDEAHVYRGANATEIAMLLRRLRDRVTDGDRNHRIQAIATSATLGSGREDFPAVADFASKLFDIPFEWDDEDPERQDVVDAERIPVTALGETWGAGTAAMYGQLHELAEAWRDPSEDSSQAQGVSSIGSGVTPVPAAVWQAAHQAGLQDPEWVVPIFLYELLKGDKNVHRLRIWLEEQGPTDLMRLADELFDGDAEMIVNLISAAILARTGPENAPLLPARYHVFARALEGAFVCLNRHAPEHQGKNPEPRLFLRRQKYCPHCSSRVFELANCTRCGTAYLT